MTTRINVYSPTGQQYEFDLKSPIKTRHLKIAIEQKICISRDDIVLYQFGQLLEDTEIVEPSYMSVYQVSVSTPDHKKESKVISSVNNIILQEKSTVNDEALARYREYQSYQAYFLPSMNFPPNYATEIASLLNINPNESLVYFMYRLAKFDIHLASTYLISPAEFYNRRRFRMDLSMDRLRYLRQARLRNADIDLPPSRRLYQPPQPRPQHTPPITRTPNGKLHYQPPPRIGDAPNPRPATQPSDNARRPMPNIPPPQIDAVTPRLSKQKARQPIPDDWDEMPPRPAPTENTQQVTRQKRSAPPPPPQLPQRPPQPELPSQFQRPPQPQLPPQFQRPPQPPRSDLISAMENQHSLSDDEKRNLRELSMVLNVSYDQCLQCFIIAGKDFDATQAMLV